MVPMTGIQLMNKTALPDYALRPCARWKGARASRSYPEDGSLNVLSAGGRHGAASCAATGDALRLRSASGVPPRGKEKGPPERALPSQGAITERHFPLFAYFRLEKDLLFLDTLRDIKAFLELGE